MDISGEPLRISIELDRRAEPVAGTISVSGAEPRAFLGWMELAHAIDLGRQSQGGTGGKSDDGAEPAG
jgi:hypothetical protein